MSLEAPMARSAVDPKQAPAFWLPNLSAKQILIFSAYSRYLLVSGPRRSGKTIGVLHKLVRHAYDVRDARIIMLAKNIKLAKEGGPWDDLIGTVLPEWEAAGILQVVTPPKLDAQTRSLYCEVSNRYGGVTRIYLGSLEYDDDAEKLLRGRKFSLVYIVEGTNFKKRSLLTTAIQCLRTGFPDSARQIIIDCNPAEEGEEHWLYKVFWTERLSESAPEHFNTEQDKEKYRAFQRNLEVIEVMIPDNPFLTPAEIDELYSQYHYDETLLARYFHGRWVSSNADAIFAQQFKPEIHILGNADKPNLEDWDVILIPEDTVEMFSGWDLGDRNSVTLFGCKETDEQGRARYSIVDEIVVENDTVELESYVEAAMKIISKWEDFVGRPLSWRAWSDTSSFNKRLPAEGHEAALIEEISKRHVVRNNLSASRVIRLMRASKYKGSVQDGIKLIKRLLFENRLFISAHCINTIQMFRSFKMERARGTGIERVPDNQWTHKFDALRYFLQSESPIELNMARTRIGKSQARIVSLG
jgi:PBSX family phage terminase large subunit